MSSGPWDRLRDMTLEPFEALIGTWETEATHPMFDDVVAGRVTFAWLEGRAFVIERSANEHPAFPDAIAVIGPPEDGEGIVAEYFDQRGVRRTYGIAIEDGVLRQWRDDPAFAQRAEATLHPGAFVLQWQAAETPGDWRDDLRVVHRRAR
ncbi:MAG: uncharacterized protein JWR63_4068 [Conexibacter sp.]|nr:uncharacterized protein [Conexibacter sp.]